MKCSNCGSTNYEEDRARADLICLDCGMVMSENVISSEVEFVETSNGRSTAIGQLSNYKESRQITENRARKRIDTICGQLRLGNDISVSGFRYYQSALFRGLTRGRNALIIAASCIYLAARQLRVNLMLLDLSDAVGINVYALGKVYVDLKIRLNLAIPEMDPCLYIERFANQLEFGEKTPAVATTAMRLLQRMKKDWISTGRRPSGLAAAALLVAARIHEFNRTEEDVSRIARISQYTARKRLEEFGRTPTSALSIEAFFSVDYAEEQDPPAYTMSMQKIDDKLKDLSDVALSQISLEIDELQRRIDDEIQKLSNKYASRKFGGKFAKLDMGQSKGVQHLINSPDLPECDSSVEKSPDQAKLKKVYNRTILRDVMDGLVEPDLLESCVDDLEILTQHSGSKMCDLLNETEEFRNMADLGDEPKSARSKTPDSKNLLLFESHTDGLVPDTSSGKLPVFLPLSAAAEKNIPVLNDELILEDIDDDELEREYILQPKEVMIKAAMWFKENAEHLEKSRRRRLAKQQQLQQNEDNKGGKKRKTGGPKSRKPNSTTSITRSHIGITINNEEDLDSKQFSRKINYKALEAVVGLSGSSSYAPSSVLDGAEDQQLLQSGSNDQPNQTESYPVVGPGPLLAATLDQDRETSELFKKPAHPVSVDKPSVKFKTNLIETIPCSTSTQNTSTDTVDEDREAGGDSVLDVDDELENEEEVEVEEEDNSYLPSYELENVDWSNGDELW